MAANFIPENDLHITINAKSQSTITEEEFHQSIDEIEALYKNEVSARGGELVMSKKWENSTVNAFAARLGNRGEKWVVSMYGGLARHPLTTLDAFRLVVCHELGHHLGGVPKKRMAFAADPKWASIEGQSDYFAATKCLKKLFSSHDNKTILANKNVPKVVIDQCNLAFKESEQSYLCQRVAMAGHDAAILINGISKKKSKKDPSFATPEKKSVFMTNKSHPSAQCRLDTFFQAALCTVDFNDQLSNDDLHIGACTPSNGHQEGMRARCWMKKH